MLIIRKAQLDAFRLPVRKAAPKFLEAALAEHGATVARDPETGEMLATNTLGHTTRIGFRDDGLPDKVVRPSGLLTRLEYDAQGRLAAVTYPGGRRLEMERDPRGNLVRLERPGLCAYQLEHDEEGRVLSIRYPDDRVVKFQRAPTGRVTILTDRAGKSTMLPMSSQGGLASITDPLQREVSFVIDEEDGTLQGVRFPDDSEEKYRRDPDTGAATVLRRDGSQVRIAGDDEGRVSRVEWPDGSSLELDYGEAGNIVEAATKTARALYERDDDGRPLVETVEELVEELDDEGRAIRRPAGTTTVRYEYDSEGQLVRLITPHGDTIAYEYDADGRVVGIVDWEGRESRLTYGPDGTIARIRHGTHLAEFRAYPALGRLGKAWVTGPDGKPISEQTYQYDACERLTLMVDRWGTDLKSRWERQFTYDAEDRLLAEVDPRSHKPIVDYEYDDKGNRVRALTTTVRIGTMDQPVRHGEVGMRYDGLGNLARVPREDAATECHWSPDGTLRSTIAGGHHTTYSYDPLGRRVLKDHGDHVTTRYGWAGHQLLWEERREGLDAKPVRRDYLWMPGGIVPLAFREEGKTFWLQCDARGAVVRAYDEQSKIAWLATYDSFGKASVEVDHVRQPFRLPGHYCDDECGLHYSLTRTYSPDLRAYVSREPRSCRLGQPPYAYCHHDPWNRMAPFGTPVFLTDPGTLSLGAILGATVADAASTALAADPIAGAVEALAGALGTIVGFAPAAGAASPAGGLSDRAAQAVALSLAELARSGDQVVATGEPVPMSLAAAIDLALLAFGQAPGVREVAFADASKLSCVTEGEFARARAIGGALVGKIAKRTARGNAMTNAAARRFLQIAEKHAIQLSVYPTTKRLAARLEAGHSPKPSFLRTRPIDEVDLVLGARLDGLGTLGFFLPKTPDRQLGQSDPALYEKALARHRERTKEYRKYRKQLERLAEQGVLAVRGGIVVDTRDTLGGAPNPGRGKGYVGHYGVFDITDVSGNPLPDDQKRKVLNELALPPVRARHGALSDWATHSPHTFDQETFDAIVGAVTSGEQTLGRFGADGFTETFATPSAQPDLSQTRGQGTGHPGNV